MTDTRQMSVADLRAALVERANFTWDEVNEIKGKSKLAELYMKHIGGETEAAFDFNSIEHEVPPTQISLENDVSYYSAEWHDYVMSHFEASELDDGKPKVEGLRRVAGLLLGPVVVSVPVKMEWQNDGTGVGRAFCVYHLKIDWRRRPDGYKDLLHQGMREFGGTGSCSTYNQSDGRFNVFPEPIAEVRAESRAYRKALQLKVVAADELNAPPTQVLVEKPPRTVEDLEQELATSQQKALIKTKMQQLQVNWEEFGLNSANDLDAVTVEKARDIIIQLNEKQR